MPGRLRDRSVIVTGAGGGIGRAVAVSLAGEGARVLVNDVNSQSAASVVNEIEAGGGTAAADNHAVGSVEAADALIDEAIQAFGNLDVLINNAGILRDKMLHNMSEEDFDRVIEVHLKGTWACGRAAVRHWRPLAKQERTDGAVRTRKIINVTSASGLIGAVG